MSGKFPRKFGKYVLLKSLAKGGMGEIYVAAGGQIGGFEKLCVIKKVITEKADRSKANRFLDEAKVVLRLSHSCLVTTFDAGEVDGEFYIAMELIEGKDLREVWNRCVQTRERIPLDVALHVVREVARALSYVHGYGNLKLVHRDVAPPNILLAYVGDVKLTDFGLARSVLKQEHTAPGVVYGRAAYLAPEQARGEVADSRTDVYTLGVVLWELLTGQQFLQISGLDPATALAIVRHPKIAKPSSKAPWITADLDAVVMKALAPTREERYQSADEMRRALNEIIATIAPRAGADRINDFLENIYRDVIVEERNERDRFLQEAAGPARTETDPAPAAPGASADPGRPPGEDSRTQPRVKVAPRPTPRPPTRRPLAPGAGQAPPAGGAPRLPGLPPSPKPPDAVLIAKGAPARKHAVRAAGAAPQPPPFDSSIGDGEELRARFIGRVVGGRYRIVAAIGEGGMGQVFSAEHVEIGKRAAIKVLNPSCSGRADLVERFRLEARAASKIGHPNIVDVTDFGTTEEGLVYYVMEQLDGIDLAEVLAQERRVDPERAVQISIQVCQALQAAHEQKIIHRDLKPENIFLSPRGAQGDAVKIIDFGLARSLQEAAVGKDGRPLTNPGTPIGTPEYMAPEQADGKPADERSDIYAVGAILYEMITGVPAFSGSFGDVLVKKSSQRPNLPHELKPDVSRELSDIVMTAMDPDPARRPQTMRELEYDLTRVLRGRGKAVAAFLGIEPDQHDTPTPVHGVGIYAPGMTAEAGAGTSTAQARRIVSLDKAAGTESKARAPQFPLEVSDLTVPAAMVFPDIEHEPNIPAATVEDLPTMAGNRLWVPRAAPAAPAATAAAATPPVAPAPRAASPRPPSPVHGQGEGRTSGARPLGDVAAAAAPAPRATGEAAAARLSAPAPMPMVGQAFLERHGLRQDGSKAEGGGHKTMALVGAGLAVLVVVVILLLR